MLDWMYTSIFLEVQVIDQEGRVLDGVKATSYG